VPVPTDPDCDEKVWRYMSFSRFVWLLQNKQLWLSRADLLGDPWELSPSGSQLATARRVTGLNVVEPTIIAGPSAFETIVNNWRTRTFVSCWTAQPQESHALWRIYCGATEGVAIQATLARLKLSTSGIPVERMIYRDPETRPINENIALTELAIEKRPMFAYEHEVRIIFKAPAPSPDHGHLPAFNPETTIENVFVHPDADASFLATVQSIVGRYAPALSNYVKCSAMKARPPF
jgi:hypothetical protein